MQRFITAVDVLIVTPPRRITPGQTCFVTVRAVNRSYRFVPTRDVRDAIAYCLGVSLARFRGRISLHEFLWMSNHFHLVLTDAEGCLPRFMESMNSLLSRSLNALRGIQGTNIEKGYNLVAVLSEERVLSHCVYTLANPCSAHLVARSRHWKGVSSLKLEYGVAWRIRRPQRGLWSDEAHGHPHERGTAEGRRPCRGRTALPETVDVIIERPAARPELTDAELRQCIRARLDTRERQLIDERHQARRSVVGWKAVVKTSFWAVARRDEPAFTTVPRISGDCREERARGFQDWRSFVKRYRAAISRFLAGDRSVQFPLGTWLMRVRFGVVCCPLPST